MDSMALLTMIGQIQLALQHPENIGIGSNMARAFIEHITPQLAQIDPMYKIIIDAGFTRGTYN